MKLTFDRQTENRPGLHALVVGVSEYPNLPGHGELSTDRSFGMHPLTASARSAFKLFQFLKDNADSFSVPLATCQLLVSPTVSEREREPQLAALITEEKAVSVELDAFLEAASAWRDRVASNSKNAAMFYFSGHGIRRTADDAVLLLNNFGQQHGGALKNTVDVASIVNGMSPTSTRPSMAKTQLYFVDACRNSPRQIKNFNQMQTTDVFDPELADDDNRNKPIYWATVDGQKAYAVKFDQTVFSKALIKSFENAADLDEDEGCWSVTVQRLSAGLGYYLQKILKSKRGKQSVRLGGESFEAPVRILASSPKTDVVLELKPAEFSKHAVVSVSPAVGGKPQQLPSPVTPHPFEFEVDAGTHKVGVDLSSNGGMQYKECTAIPLKLNRWQCP